jgi:hypothetical protein
MSGYTHGMRKAPEAAPLPWSLNNGGREIQDALGRIVVKAKINPNRPGMAEASLAMIVDAVNKLALDSAAGGSA